jgi:hypothetical protein
MSKAKVANDKVTPIDSAIKVVDSDPTFTVSSTEMCEIKKDLKKYKHYANHEKITIQSRLQQIKATKFHLKVFDIIQECGELHTIDDTACTIDLRTFKDKTLFQIETLLDKYDEKFKKMAGSNWLQSIN